MYFSITVFHTLKEKAVRFFGFFLKAEVFSLAFNIGPTLLSGKKKKVWSNIGSISINLGLEYPEIMQWFFAWQPTNVSSFLIWIYQNNSNGLSFI